MENITLDQINKDLAEFMDYKFKDDLFSITEIKERGGDIKVFECWAPNYNYYPDIFTESLDALVPVWDKLGCSFKLYYLMGNHRVTTPFGTILYNSMEIQEAAARATHKAVKELK